LAANVSAVERVVGFKDMDLMILPADFTDVSDD
jgi:hypothetical protein